MAEPVSALAGLSTDGLSGAQGGGRVTLREVPSGTVLRIQAWPQTVAAVRSVATELLGMEAPAIGQAATRDDVTLAATAPGTFFAAGLAQEIGWLVQEALPATDAAVTDLSHARTILALEGRAAAEVLQTCVMLDLGTFPTGRVAQTMIHHVDVLIHRRAETRFDLWVMRSFALSLAEWLLDAGLEMGLEFRPAATPPARQKPE